MSIKVKVLGTGTSTGVPIPLCQCAVCQSAEPENNRTRVSVYIQLNQQRKSDHSDSFGILIDTTPDLRIQALTHKIPRIDAVLITHTHADHVFGIDDLRGFNFAQKTRIPVYASNTSAEILSSMFSYCFFPDPDYEGGAPPALSLQKIEINRSFQLGGHIIEPLPVLHGKTEVLGFRVNDFAYVTDCSEIPQSTKSKMENLDTLILDGLRFRPHPTHYNLEQAIEVVEELAPKHTYLTHISHDVDYKEGCEYLKKNSNKHIELAYDGLELSFD